MIAQFKCFFTFLNVTLSILHEFELQEAISFQFHFIQIFTESLFVLALSFEVLRPKYDLFPTYPFALVFSYVVIVVFIRCSLVVL